MRETLEFKFAKEVDLPLILTFIRKLAEHDNVLHKVVTTEETLKENIFKENANVEVVLGYQDHVPVAFALFFYDFCSASGMPGLFIEDLYVSPEVRGSGIGKQLFRFLAHLASERSCDRLQWIVHNNNKAAIKFYESMGGKPLKDWTTYKLNLDTFEDSSNPGNI